MDTKNTTADSEGVALAEDMGYCLGRAFVLVWGAEKHDNPVESLELARDCIHREIDRRKGFILRGETPDAYVPDTMVNRFRRIIEAESGSKGQALTLIFSSHQMPVAIRTLSAAIIHINDYILEVQP